MIGHSRAAAKKLAAGLRRYASGKKVGTVAVPLPHRRSVLPRLPSNGAPCYSPDLPPCRRQASTSPATLLLPLRLGPRTRPQTSSHRGVQGAQQPPKLPGRRRVQQQRARQSLLPPPPLPRQQRRRRRPAAQRLQQEPSLQPHSPLPPPLPPPLLPSQWLPPHRQQPVQPQLQQQQQQQQRPKRRQRPQSRQLRLPLSAQPHPQQHPSRQQ